MFALLLEPKPAKLAKWSSVESDLLSGISLLGSSLSEVRSIQADATHQVAKARVGAEIFNPGIAL
jgi:hypothetical protein